MKESEINRWMTRIRLSEEDRKLKQPLWDDLGRYFRGVQMKNTGGQDMLVVNLAYSHVKIVVPSVYSRNPKAYVDPEQRYSFGRNEEGQQAYDSGCIDLRYRLHKNDLRDGGRNLGGR